MKTAIIIGASSGIGRELAKLLAQDKYRVGVAGRRLHLLAELQSELGNSAVTRCIDISQPANAQDELKSLIEEMGGGVDLVVISAGTGHLNPDLEWSLENDTIATNVTGFTAVANTAMKHFMERRSGHLVGISSVAALRGSNEAPAYNASKAFISNYLEGLRQKAVKSGVAVTVTDVKPGFVDTAMAKGNGLFWVASPQKAALQINNAIRRRKSHVYITRRWRLVGWLLRLMPGFIYERL